MLGQYLPLAAHSKGMISPGNTCGEVHQVSKLSSTFTPDTSTALEPPGWTGSWAAHPHITLRLDLPLP